MLVLLTGLQSWYIFKSIIMQSEIEIYFEVWEILFCVFGDIFNIVDIFLNNIFDVSVNISNEHFFFKLLQNMNWNYWKKSSLIHFSLYIIYLFVIMVKCKII